MKKSFGDYCKENNLDLYVKFKALMHQIDAVPYDDPKILEDKKQYIKNLQSQATAHGALLEPIEASFEDFKKDFLLLKQQINEHGYDINDICKLDLNKNQVNLLRHAIAQSKFDVAEFLIEQGAIVSALDIRMLVEQSAVAVGTKRNKSFQKGLSVVATMFGKQPQNQTDSAEYLQSNSATDFLKNIAIRQYSEKEKRDLKREKEKRDLKREKECVLRAIETDNLDVLKLLLECNFAADEKECVLRAIETDNLDVLKLLLAHDFDYNQELNYFPTRGQIATFHKMKKPFPLPALRQLRDDKQREIDKEKFENKILYPVKSLVPGFLLGLAFMIAATFIFEPFFLALAADPAMGIAFGIVFGTIAVTAIAAELIAVAYNYFGPLGKQERALNKEMDGLEKANFPISAAKRSHYIIVPTFHNDRVEEKLEIPSDFSESFKVILQFVERPTKEVQNQTIQQVGNNEQISQITVE